MYEVQMLFFRGVKATLQTKNVCGKRPDNAGKDKIIHLFLELGNPQTFE